MKALALALLLAVASAAAAPPSYRPNMTGEQFVRDMLADPFVGRNSAKRERAMGYMEGVMDATAGVRWCPTKDMPHELNYIVAGEMDDLSQDQLEGNAIVPMLVILSRRYPCPPAGAKR